MYAYRTEKVLIFMKHWKIYLKNTFNQLLEKNIKLNELSENEIEFSVKNSKGKVNISFQAYEREEEIPSIYDFTILWGWKFPDIVFRNCEKLKWIQTSSAGVDHLLENRFFPSKVILTNARGFHGELIAQYVLGSILGHTKGLFVNVQANMNGETHSLLPDTLKDKIVGIVGTGDIGSSTAKICSMLGLKTIGLRRTGGQKKWFDKIYTTEQYKEFYPQCNFLVLTAPLTSETKYMIDKKILNLLPSDAYLINVGRGELLIEDELINAIESGHIAGSTLDVWEGKKPSEKLLNCKQILITPHFSSLSRDYANSATKIFIENLFKFINDKPLFNIVNKKLGY